MKKMESKSLTNIHNWIKSRKEAFEKWQKNVSYRNGIKSKAAEKNGLNNRIPQPFYDILKMQK